MKKIAVLGLAFAASMSATVMANPPAKEMVCRACHGEGGGKTLMPTYPKLKGQNKEYLAMVLREYKAGKRQGGQAAVMSAQAAALSDKDIDELAAYYASQQ